jgi:tryptophan synthase alpha chain
MSCSNRIDNAFAKLSTNGRKGLLPYVTAGYPNLATTADLLTRFDQLGVTAVELGIPYSDSIADGPVIQTSFTRTLDGKLRIGQVFDMVRRLRGQVDLPILSMLSFSIVHRIGVDAYIEQAKAAGIDGMIIPDLSLEEAPQIAGRVEAAGLRLAMLVAPTTPPERRRRIAELSSGFVYYMSVSGITGERDQLPAELVANVAELRQHSGKPVCVGFGISTPAHVQSVCRAADGAIVGSAIVRRITQGVDAGLERVAIVQSAAAFVGELMEGLRPA